MDDEARVIDMIHHILLIYLIVLFVDTKYAFALNITPRPSSISLDNVSQKCKIDYVCSMFTLWY